MSDKSVEKQNIDLKHLYDEIVVDFEEASEQAESLVSQNPNSPAWKVKTWLKNATASLISWGIDVRVESGSLSAIEKTSLKSGIQSLLQEIQDDLKTVLEEDKRLDEHESFKKTMTSGPQNLANYHSEESADQDTIAVMSSHIVTLQDLIRPIRMMHASERQEGPYRNLKQQVENIYKQHLTDADKKVA